MKLRLVLGAVLIAGVVPAYAADRAEIDRKVEALDAQSQKLLGVSLNALRYLVGASGNSYFPLWHLEKTGDIKFIRELEAKKYVSVEVRVGLPDGHEQNQQFVRVIPSGDGLQLQQCVLALSSK